LVAIKRLTRSPEKTTLLTNREQFPRFTY